jgi:hypothetical protein
MTLDMTVDVLERISTFTTLGLRFWEAALDQQVRDGLVVTARPAIARTVPRRAATRTLSGVYAFPGLPGLRDVEHGLAGPGDSPGERRRFVIEVDDALRRYVPVAFDVELPLPYRGVFLFGGLHDSPGERPLGMLLYAAATRRRPTWIGAVAGELVDAATRRPAAHALLAATDPNGEVWHGVADEGGRFSVWMAYPAIEELPAGSPQPAGGVPLLERTWPIRLEVFYSPDTRRALPGTRLPDYGSVLTQQPAVVWDEAPEAGGAPALDWTGELRLGRELNPRTTGMTQLLVGPETTSP